MKKTTLIIVLTLVIATVLSMTTVLTLAVSGAVQWPGAPNCISEPNNLLCTCPEGSYKARDGPELSEFTCLPTGSPDSLDCMWCNGGCIIWTKENSLICDSTPVPNKVCVFDNTCTIESVSSGSVLTFCTRDEFQNYVLNYQGNFYQLDQYFKDSCEGYIYELDGCQTFYTGHVWESGTDTVGIFECLSGCYDTSGRATGGYVIWAGGWVESSVDNSRRLWAPNWYSVMSNCGLGYEHQ